MGTMGTIGYLKKRVYFYVYLYKIYPTSRLVINVIYNIYYIFQKILYITPLLFLLMKIYIK